MQVQSEEKKITFNCPKCAATLKVPSKLAGVSGPCPKCGGVIVAPHPEAQETQRRVQRPAPQRPPVAMDQGTPSMGLTMPMAPPPVTPTPTLAPPSSYAISPPPQIESPSALETQQQARILQPLPEPQKISTPKPPPVQIEDFNGPVPLPARSNQFPQAFQKAIVSDKTPDAESDSFDEIDVKPSIPETGPILTVSESHLPALPALPKPYVATEAPPTVGSASELKIPHPVSPPPQRPQPQPQAPETPEIQSPPAPASVEVPRVSLTTIPAAPPLQAASASPRPTVSAEISAQKDAAAPASNGPAGLSNPRIKRGGRQEAVSAASAAAATDNSETRPITPVSRPEFQTAPTNPTDGTRGIAEPMTPRLDVSLANGPATHVDPSRSLPVKQVSSNKPVGPTRIKLPQLAGEPKPVPTSQPMPLEVPLVEMPGHLPQAAPQQHSPQPQPQQHPEPAPDPTSVPAIRVQKQAPAEQAQPPQETAAYSLPQSHDDRILEELERSIGNQPQSALPEPRYGQQYPEQLPRQQAPQQFSTEPAPGRQQRQQADPGLGDVILRETTGPIPLAPQQQDSSEFNDLFGSGSSSQKSRKRISLLHVGVIAAVFGLATITILLIAKAFGAFSLPEEVGKPSSVTATSIDETDKPAVARPPEKPAIENPTEPNGENVAENTTTFEGNSPAPAVAIASTESGNKGVGSLILSDGTGTSTTAVLPGNSETDNTLPDSTPRETDLTASNSVKLPAFDTPGTYVPPGNEDIPDKIRNNIAGATSAIQPIVGESMNGNTTGVSPVPENGISPGIDNLVQPDPTSMLPNTTANLPDTSTGSNMGANTGPTGEFRNTAPNPSTINGPPGPESFTPPSQGNSKLGSSRELVETFLKSPTWQDQLPYVYKADQVKPVMEAYYKQWPYKTMAPFALKFEQMESDPELNGPYWIYNVNTSDNTEGFPIVVRQENNLLKVDWGVQAEFRDELFAKFQNGEISGKQTFRLILEHQTGYYGSDAEAFTNIGDYLIYRIAPPYGGREHEDIAVIAKNSPTGNELNKLVPLYSSPLAVIVELENQSFPHGINHLVITKLVTDGWFE